MIEQGKPAPSLSGTTGDGNTIKLDDFRGQWLVVYFYPRDNTPGCTTEAKDFRDLYPEFRQHNAEIIGVSRDSLKSHQKFADKFELPFPLISDDQEDLCTRFGVMKLKNMYGKQVRGIDRSTFLFDKRGVLIQEWRGVRVSGHAKEVLQAARNLAS